MNRRFWWWNLIPPLAAAVKTLRSPAPFTEIRDKSVSQFWTYCVLALPLFLTMMIIWAGDLAPYVDPVSAIWLHRIKLFVVPTANWSVLSQIAAIAIAAVAMACGASALAGARLGDRQRGERRHAITLSAYATFGAAVMYLVLMLTVYGIGWLLAAIQIRIYVLAWMIFASFAFVPICSQWLVGLFRRTTLPRLGHFSSALLISSGVMTTCLVGALHSLNRADAAMHNYGVSVNHARQTATATIVQACEKAADDIVCAVTLFPEKWQDYELIGNWTLGEINEAGVKLTDLQWQPTHDANHAFAVVALTARQDVTVEIRVKANSVCTAQSSQALEQDHFFFVTGRIRGEQTRSPLQLRLRIDNTPETLADLVRQSCVEGKDGERQRQA